MSSLGLDVGTSAVKGLLLGRDGRIIALARRGYRERLPEPGHVELSSARVWAATRAVIARLARAAADAGDPVTALATGGSGDEMVMLDDRDRPVGPVMLALDRRAAAIAAELDERFGRRWLSECTGLASSRMAPLPRLLWLRRHDPHRAERVRRMLAWPELVALRLGVPPRAEPTLAARSLAFDVREDRYAADILAALDVDEGLFAPLVPTGSAIGTLPGAAADGLGLPRGALVVAGGFDQSMAALGAGVVEPGVAHVGTGSWEAITALLDRPVTDDGMRAGGWSVGRSIGGVLPWSAMTSYLGGAAIRWAARLARADTEGGAAPPLPRLLREASAGPGPVLALAQLEGSVGPLSDEAARGVLAGLDLGTTRGQLLAALLESLTFQLRAGLEQLASAGVDVRTLRASGGGARSRAWLQLKADVTGRVVERPQVEEVGAFAAALLAGAATGDLPSPGVAARELTRVRLRLEPRPERAARYAERAERHAALVAAMAAWHAGAV